MEKSLSFFLITIALGSTTIVEAAREKPAPIKVPVYFFEALAPRDTTSSETFRKEFESSVKLGQKLLDADLRKCGYQIDPQIDLYDANDPLQAFEKSKAAQEANAWFIVGPRRSNHYLLVAKGAPAVPSVSIMASSREVEKLAPRHLSIYPSNEVLARAAAKATKPLGKTYLNVISDDCHACVDFALAFDAEAAKLNLHKLNELKVVGESPEPTQAKEIVLRLKPDFVLLPNYSKVSAHLMGAIHEVAPKVIFMGGDGWGDQKFGFVEKNPSTAQAPGYTVRGFPPADRGLSQFELGRRALKEKDFVPSSGPGLAILKILEGLKTTLCTAKPKDPDAFKTLFDKVGKHHFKSPWGVSLYQLKAGSISFSKPLLEAKK